VSPTAAPGVPRGRGPGRPAPYQQRQRPRGQQIAGPSAHRLPARGRPAPHLDGWLAGLLDPANLDATSTRSSPPARTPAAPPRRCARSSGRWPTAGTSSPATERRWTPGLDLATVTEWINHATAERAGAEAKRAELRAATPVAVTKDQLRAVVRQAGGLVRIVDSADPGQRAQRYEKLGVEGLYQPAERLVVVTADVVSEWFESPHRHEPPLSRSAPSPVLPRLLAAIPWAPALYLKEGAGDSGVAGSLWAAMTGSFAWQGIQTVAGSEQTLPWPTVMFEWFFSSDQSAVFSVASSIPPGSGGQLIASICRVRPTGTDYPNRRSTASGRSSKLDGPAPVALRSYLPHSPHTAARPPFTLAAEAA